MFNKFVRKSSTNNNNDKSKWWKNPKFKFIVLVWAFLLGLLLTSALTAPEPPKHEPLEKVMSQIAAKDSSKAIKEIHLEDAQRSVTIEYKDKDKRQITSSYPSDYGTVIINAAKKNKVEVDVLNNFGLKQPLWRSLLGLLPTLIIVGLLFWFIRSSLGLDDSKKQIGAVPDTRFVDVAGQDEAILDFGEITDFLADAEKFRAIGARVPGGILLSGPPGCGKALHKDTIIPTFNKGLSTVGDLDKGDVIIDENGNPTTILAKYQPMTEDHYEIKFSDGSTVRACGDHLWNVQNKQQRMYKEQNKKRQRKTHTTREVVNKFIQTKPDQFTYNDLMKEFKVSKTIANRFLKKNPEGLLKDGYGRIYSKNAFKNKIIKAFSEPYYSQIKETSSVLSTREMARNFNNTDKYSIEAASAVNYTAKDLSFDPYALGLWLGDGDSRNPKICGLIEDLEFYEKTITSELNGIRQVNRDIYKRPFGNLELGRRNTDLNGVKCNTFLQFMQKYDLYRNKHIPFDYLYGSIEQRVNLLAGLLDSDGYIDERQGRVSISQKDENLARQIFILVNSLGIKATFKSKRKKFNGVPFEAHEINFTPTIQVFKLPRKANVLHKWIEDRRSNSPINRRFITSISQIDDKPEDYFCFTVDSQNHLFLCTERFIPTHNTLLARAVAGETGVPFYAVSGSDFINKFVGVGASSVRKLFAKAKKHDKAIIFIDELDAVGAARSNGGDGAEREHNQTVNALLTEMDGFEGSNVIVIAATNNPDGLDGALTRTGRFDRKIVVDLPDWKGRKEILLVHLRGKTYGEDVNFDTLAKSTTGMSGADLEGLVNEALINAVRHDRMIAIQEDFMEALSLISIGRARKSLVITEKDKEITAYHEAGHAVVAMALEELEDPSHVTIVPRGFSGGHTKIQESENRFQTKSTLKAKLAMMMGGYAAEMKTLGEITQGPGSDLVQATKLAENMITKMAMGSTLSIVSDESLTINSNTSEIVRVQVEDLIKTSIETATNIINGEKWAPVFEAMAEKLLQVETLETVDIQELKVLAND